MNKILARLLPVALLVGFVTGAGLDDDLIKDFKKYFRKYKDPAQRREAVLALDGIDSPAMVDVLVPVLEDPDPQVTQAVVRVLGSLEERAAIDHLLVELAEEILHMPVRLGAPQSVTGLGEVVRNPIYSTGVGLLLFGHRNAAGRPASSLNDGGFRSVWDRMKSWFQGNF